MCRQAWRSNFESGWRARAGMTKIGCSHSPWNARGIAPDQRQRISKGSPEASSRHGGPHRRGSAFAATDLLRTIRTVCERARRNSPDALGRRVGDWERFPAGRPRIAPVCGDGSRGRALLQQREAKHARRSLVSGPRNDFAHAHGRLPLVRRFGIDDRELPNGHGTVIGDH